MCDNEVNELCQQLLCMSVGSTSATTAIREVVKLSASAADPTELSISPTYLIAATVTMAEANQKRERTVQSIKLVAPFDGDRNYLALYIDCLNGLMPASSSLNESERPFYFQCIISTLRGPALDVVRREQPETWEVLRNLLIEEFADPTPVTTAILMVGNIKFKGSVRLLCEEINAEVCKIKDSIKLRESNTSSINFLYTELTRTSLKTLKRELPFHLVALINANTVTDVKSAIQILRENEVYDNVVIGKNTKSNPSKQQFNNYRIPNAHSTLAYNNPQYNPYNNGFADTQQYFPYDPSNVQQSPYPPPCNTRFSFNPQNQAHSSQFNSNNNFQNPLQNSYNKQAVHSQQTYRNKGNNSNQSRIRRFGIPEPMEQDNENFRLEASDTYQKFN